MLRRVFFLLMVLLPLWLPSAAQAQPAARVGAWTVDLADLDKILAPQMFDLRSEKIEEMVTDHLLGLEAKAQGIPKEKVMETLAEKGIEVPTDAEVKRFIESNKGRLPKEGVGMEGRVRDFMLDQIKQGAHTRFLKGLMAKYDAKILLEAPRNQVSGPQDLAFGPEKAPVSIIEFSDFECPYCRRVQPILTALKTKYGDKVRFVFRHYPLPFHKKAPKASEAAQCAAEQGKFWEFHKALFADENLLELPKLVELAKSLGLNMELFNSCQSNPKTASRVAADLEEGKKLGITGTPTFFINGIKLVGAVPLEEFEKVIDAELVPKK